MHNLSTVTNGTGTRPYIRALATSQGHHWTGIRAADDGAEFLEMQARHDAVSDAYFKRADDELDIALELRDWSAIHNHIRVSMNFRAEGYRHEALEDERREQARASLSEIHDASQAGSYVCESVLRRDAVCEHGDAA